MHDACEHARHACEHAVGDGGVDVEEIAQCHGDEVAEEGAGEERRSEDAAHAARRVGDGRGHHLQDHDAEQEEQQDSVLVADDAEERRVLEERDAVVAHERGDVLVALAVEGGEDEDERAEGDAAEDEFHTPLFDLGEQPFHEARGAQEIDRQEAGGDADDDIDPDVVQLERRGGRVGEHDVFAEKAEGEESAGGGGDEQRHHRRRRQVEHEHFDGEDHRGDGRLEDGRHGRRAAAAEQQDRLLRRQLEEPRQVGAHRRASEHDRGLHTYRTAEANRQRTRYHRTIYVVRTELSSVVADGV